MRVSIYEIAERLGLDPKEFRELVDEGRLDGVQLDRDCIERVRKMFLDAARRKPPPTAH